MFVRFSGNPYKLRMNWGGKLPRQDSNLRPAG
jgi:hypothetical protein